MGDPELFGRYLVYERLGVGGMASVHRAELSGVDGFTKVVALKRMLPHVATDEDMVKAFVREARLASYLRHINVAQTYELGRVDGTYFIAMELVQGRSLREVFRHCAQTTGCMPVPVALNILSQICDALDYAHNLADETGQPLGIIHRDVTPSNIILSTQGVVKLIDFGIAKASAAGMQTMSGTIKGKFGYMAPEYIGGRIDARADLFAIGVIGHELLTNRPLFTAGDDMETLQRLQNMEVQPPSRRNSDVPHEIDALVMTALERDPERRWQGAHALRNALQTMIGRLGLEADNSEVVRWVDWVHEQTGRNRIAPVAEEPDPNDTLTSNDLSPVIEMLPGATIVPESIVLASSPMMPTLVPGYAPELDVRPMRAASSHAATPRPAEVRAPSMADVQPAYVPEPRSKRASVAPPPASVLANYPRRHELAPSAGFRAEDVIPTAVRQSNPKIALPALARDPAELAPTTPRAPVVVVAPVPRPAPAAARKPSWIPMVLVLILTATVTAVVVYFALQ